jgi:hypothetical protein
MKKVSFLFLALFFFTKTTKAQVPKKVIVEHFTNTKCSICAARNPGFYNNLNNQNGVIHLAIHPSSPYPACVLSQQNVSENDARTNYYGIYGGTPRLVIQGVVVPSSADYSSSSLFTAYLSQTSPASVKITQTKFGNDSIRSRVTVKTEASHTLGNLKLFIALAEDTLIYTGSNGEPKHYDVFRKSLSGATGMNFILPTVSGDSVVYTMSTPSNVAWNLSRINTLVILQDEITKEVIQSEYSMVKSNTPTGVNTQMNDQFSFLVFVSNRDKSIYVNQISARENLNFELYDLSGRKLLHKALNNESEKIPVSALSSKIYFYKLKSESGILKTGKLFIEN